MPATDPRQWTVDMVHSLPDDGNRYEVVEGTLLVSPAPSWLHQNAVGRLYALLLEYANAAAFHVLVAPAAVTWSPRTELQPDVLVVPFVEGRPPTRFEDAGVLVLAVEVVSPSSMRTDRFVKRREYQKRGVAEYWIVDPLGRSVERWRPEDDEPEILFESLAWQPDPEVAPLVLDLAAYFRVVHGELLSERPPR
jgi:Uma2 family endonuclease